MRRLLVTLMTVGIVGAAPAALAGPPQHCYGEFGDPCKPIYIMCQNLETWTKGRVTCD